MTASSPRGPSMTTDLTMTPSQRARWTELTTRTGCEHAAEAEVVRETQPVQTHHRRLLDEITSRVPAVGLGTARTIPAANLYVLLDCQQIPSLADRVDVIKQVARAYRVRTWTIGGSEGRRLFAASIVDAAGTMHAVAASICRVHDADPNPVFDEPDGSAGTREALPVVSETAHVAGPRPVGLAELPGVFRFSLSRYGLELALWHVRLAIGEARWRGELFAGFAAFDRTTGRTGHGWTPTRALADLRRQNSSPEARRV